MTGMGASNTPAWLINRERLVQALQGACFGSRQNLPRLRAAIATFARESSHLGMDSEWIRRAVDSALDTALTPPLEEARRRALSLTVTSLTNEACGVLGSRSAPVTSDAKLAPQHANLTRGPTRAAAPS